MKIKTFQWKHDLKDEEYDKYFDYQTKNYKYHNFDITNYSITILNEGNRLSSIKYDFGQNLNDKNATHVLYNNDSNDYIVPFNKYSYAVLKYIDETSEMVFLV